MAYRNWQLDSHGFTPLILRDVLEPWKIKHSSGRLFKRWKARCERRRARRDPECPPGYGRYDGYET
jgi:hypothetical protein